MIFSILSNYFGAALKLLRAMSIGGKKIRKKLLLLKEMLMVILTVALYY